MYILTIILLVINTYSFKFNNIKTINGFKQSNLTIRRKMTTSIVNTDDTTTFELNKEELSSYILNSYNKKEPEPTLIDIRTTSCLDFDVILNELRNFTVTSLGKALSSTQISNNANDVSLYYAMVQEITPQIDSIPLRSQMNIWGILRQIEVIGGAPEREDIINFARDIEEVNDIINFIIINQDKLSLFNDIVKQMELPEEIIEFFVDSFDDENNLDPIKYPEIGNLRQKAKSLRVQIISTIKSLLNDSKMKDKLADNGYLELEGRYCLMLKNTYKKGIGIVHGSSNTGRTLYIEPQEVVEATNELKTVLASLRTEENRVFYEMSRCISDHRDGIRRVMKAVAEIDIIRAKAQLGKKLNGVIPDVGDDGTFRCLDAKHPVLLLRGVNAIGNKVELEKDFPSLVISGPNAGGKTIVLKTVGLLVLMVKHSIPIPAKEGARVDIMDVMADIGDMQSVSGDLSTFSGHLVVCREMMKRARTFEGTSLVLLDEIGTGTDPAQGAALAQAVLEDLMNSDSRIIVTTHYQRIKELAADSESFQIAAMEFDNNVPTYRLRMGSIGESFALEAGKRMELPLDVLERANELLDDESRRIVALQQRLEEEVVIAKSKQLQAEKATKDMELLKLEVEASRTALEEELERVKKGATEEYLSDLREKEKRIEDLFNQLEQTVIQPIISNTMKSQKINELEEARKSVNAARIETETELVQQVVDKDDIAIPLEQGEPIEEGTELIVLEQGNLFGTRGRTSRRNKGRGRILMRVGGVEVKFERHLLGKPKKAGQLGFASQNKDNGELDTSKMSAKDKRLYEMLNEELVDPDKMLRQKRKKKDGNLVGVRVTSNTLDATKLNFDDLKSKISHFIEKIINKNDYGIFYIKHGTGKTADNTKTKIRTWLKKNGIIRYAKAASPSDGGDDYTIVELNLSEV